MEYPSGFNTPTFPAGSRLAATRLVAIATMVVFVLIVVMCGLLLWTQRAATVHPFLVSIDNITGQWAVVGHNHGRVREITTAQSLQESVIGKFIQYWFWVSASDNVNAALWRSCDREKQCNPENKTGIDTEECAIYCMAGEDIYSRFVASVVPDYQSRVVNGETWLVDMASIKTTPIGAIQDTGGMWQVRASVYSNKSGAIKILAYVRLARDAAQFPQTMGYYVSDFNAYKIN